MIGKSKILEGDYDLGLEGICKTIKENHHKNVLLQFPEGLKHLATMVKDKVEKETGSEVIISADPCYGACDIPSTIQDFQIDLIVQFGHAEIPNLKCSLPTMFVEAHSKLDVIPSVEKALKHLQKNVGLITTSQHIHRLEEVAEFLVKNGFYPVIGEGDGRAAHNGQVLGCNFSCATKIAKDIDCFLLIGSGNFHAIGVALATGKSVIIADPFLNEARDIEKEKNTLMRQRHGAISKVQEAKEFGILVGTKLGQTRMSLAFDMKKLVEKHDRKAYILLLHEFDPISLKSLKMDTYVSCACPRIAIDDFLMYDTPIITPQELRIAFGEAEWEDYKLDEFF